MSLIRQISYNNNVLTKPEVIRERQWNMFGKKKSAISEEVETIIGHDTEFNGTLSAKGSVRVDGQLEGQVTTMATLVIGQTGKVIAKIAAADATVAGLVQGDVEVTGRLELLPTAKLYGDITAGTLVVGEGAVFKGACKMVHNETESQNS